MLLHFWQTPGQTQLKPKVAPDWPTNNKGTKPFPQQAKGTTADDWTEGKHGSATTVRHMKHTQDTHEVPGSGEQRTLYCRALEDLFFIKPLSSRARDVANFPNT